MANKKEDKIYSIQNLSEVQLRVLKDALEMYTRLGLLQFDNVVDHMFGWGKNGDFGNTYAQNRESIEHHCYAIKDILVSQDEDLKNYPKQSHWSLGIGGEKTSKESMIAYEIEKDIDNILNTRSRGRLDLSDETPTIVKIQNTREEKLKQVIKNLKNK